MTAALLKARTHTHPHFRNLFHRYTSNGPTVYAIFSHWPPNDWIKLSVSEHIDPRKYRVWLLNDRGGNLLEGKLNNDSVQINLQKIDLLYSIKPWVLKFERFAD